MHRLFPSSKLPHIFLNLICFVGICHNAMSFKREIRNTGRFPFKTNLTQHLQCLTANIPVCNVTRPMRIDIKNPSGWMVQESLQNFSALGIFLRLTHLFLTNYCLMTPRGMTNFHILEFIPKQ